MVAYSFKKQFGEPIVSGEKCQTVRAPRKRHARVGEPVQLYVGMRTKACRKLIEPDPICTSTQIVEIHIDRDAPEIITVMMLDGTALMDHEIEFFAWCDGFRSQPGKSARHMMGEFWMREHLERDASELRFVGFVIRWEAA
ncbi:MAG: ASCH domain-containing protein [Pseudomonadota bacterium]